MKSENLFSDHDLRHDRDQDRIRSKGQGQILPDGQGQIHLQEERIDPINHRPISKKNTLLRKKFSKIEILIINGNRRKPFRV